MTDQDMMETLPHYRSKYDAAKKINVYFIPAVDLKKNEKMYFYAIASAVLHDEMLRCIKLGDIPHFAAVVEKGYGEPSDAVKKKVKAYYGFDHDEYV